MVFDLAVEPKSQRGRQAHGIAFTARRFGSGNVIGVSMIINRDVADALAWQPGTALQLQLGRGRDFGWARLRRHAAGRFKCRRLGVPGSTQLVVTLTLLGDGRRHSIATAAHRIASGALLVRLPDWALPPAREVLAEARRRRAGRGRRPAPEAAA